MSLSLQPSSVAFQAITSYAAASFTASYTQIVGRFGDGVVCIIFESSLDQDVMISFNGSTDHLRIPAGGNIIMDIRSWNGSLPGSYSVWGKEIGNPTTGLLYVSYVTQG